jgi:hypothetical protein
MQIYAAPPSDGSPELTPSEDSLVINEPFVIAITNSKVSEAFEIPLAVVSVPRSCLK